LSTGPGHTRTTLLAPRTWPTWTGLALLRLIHALPYRWQLGLGRRAGTILYHFMPARREVARTNLALCFPALDAAARTELLRAHFGAIGMSMAELAMSWWGSDGRLVRLSEIEGIEHLQAALAERRGVILLTGHFTPMELCAHILSGAVPFDAMYRPMDNPAVDWVVKRARDRRRNTTIFARDDIRAMLKSLKGGHAVWFGADQDYGREHSVFAPFFGVPAATITSTARFARMTGAAVVPYFPCRLPDGRYRIRVLPALAGFPSGDAVADATRVNALVEAAVRECPEQYLWIHRRFKTRPAGEPRPYPKQRKRRKRR
jgi:KDO2-lipid IV(A) lauroyltransferase